MIEWQFESIADLIAMAPHGAYVWSVYGLGVLVLGGLVWYVQQAHRQAITRIRRQLEREGGHESET
jgi:heme exporter protein CcmD